MADTKTAQQTALELLEEDDEFEVCARISRWNSVNSAI